MNERQRMQYLDAMGIEMFVPRLVLPNAAETVECELPIEYRSVSVDLETLPERQKSDKAAAFLSSLRQQDSKPTPILKAEDKGLDRSASALVDEIAKEAKVIESTRFTLGLWTVESGLQILDTRTPGDALPTDALLNNILMANGLLKAQLPRAEILNWPYAGVSGVNASWPAAIEMMKEFLGARLEIKAVSFILLWGEDAAKVVLGEDFNFSDSLYTICKPEHFQAQALVLPSLKHFLQNPLEKKFLWEAFKPLRSALSES